MASTDPAIKVIPGTKFVVDGFTLKNKKDYSHFFLTHFHADHYAGMTKRWNFGKIYCTSTTAQLVKNKFGTEDKMFKLLDFDHEYTIDGVKVVLFDANHCPGSSVILFELPNGKSYLHTGDMRFDKELFMKYKNLVPYFKQEQQIKAIDEDENEDEDKKSPDVKKKLEAIYLDTTYCDPMYNFPKQAEATRFISEFVKNKMRSGNKKYLFLIGTYQIGKERIAQKIAEACKCKVFVTQEK
jgi:DNA cross-link repair 1A protein